MVESMRELNRLVQKPDYQTVGNWYVRKVIRPGALPVTWLLLHTPVTANQVTTAALIAGMAGIWIMFLPGSLPFVIGSFLVQLWYLLDHVDGQIARYRKSACLTGRFYDFMMHHLIHGFFFFGLGLYGYFAAAKGESLIAGFAAAMSITLFNLMHDAKYKTYFEHLQKEGLTVTVGNGKPAAIKVSGNRSGKDRLKRIYMLAHNAAEMHVAMNLFTLAALGHGMVSFIPDLRPVLCLFYMGLAPFLVTVKMVHVVRNRTIDREYAEIIRAGR